MTEQPRTVSSLSPRTAKYPPQQYPQGHPAGFAQGYGQQSYGQPGYPPPGYAQQPYPQQSMHVRLVGKSVTKPAWTIGQILAIVFTAGLAWPFNWLSRRNKTTVTRHR